MKLLPLVLAVVLLLGTTSCFKDEVDVAELTNNPFDPGFIGPNIFTFDTTYVEQIPNPPNPPIQRQVFQFTVNSSLFLEPTAYDVYYRDLQNGETDWISQYPAGSDVIRYYKLPYVIGEETCLEVSLSNNHHQGRVETICGTLQ